MATFSYVNIILDNKKYISIEPMESFTMFSPPIKPRCDEQNCPFEGFYMGQSKKCFCFAHMFKKIENFL